ncbi:MAG: formate--tetrahydrofolate ligase [Bacteroidota bacterium]|nr:formate--tetrahydrofolate ligase [Bacteroidota bacterium]
MTDIEIAQSIVLKPIKDIAKKLDIQEDDLEFYGKYKAKLPLTLINDEKVSQSNLVLVTAITPTPAGEGKTTVSIGLNEGLNKIGKKSIVVLREPSLGPVFGIKGGAAGGGYSQVVPMEDINLHFTGDFSAVEKANNFLAAIIDNVIQNPKHEIKIDPRTVLWKRVMDMNDRSLRDIIIGIGGKANGMMRQTGFNITAASEIMAILCMSKNLSDLKERIGKILIGFTYDNQPVFASQLKVQEAMTILLKDAIKPNLVQTLEGNPAIIHGGPFANIAQGTNTIIATKIGLSLADYVVTEAGFGADLGAEKFLNLKCVYGQLKPKAMVIVATIRALRHHGGAKPDDLNTPDKERVKNGFCNLEKHIENARQFGFNPVVAINYFVTDSREEIELLKSMCLKMGVKAIESKGWGMGGNGTQELAKAVVESIESLENNYQQLYDWNLSIKEKIESIAFKIYGATSIEYTAKALNDLKQLEKIGLGKLPICMAKTQKSFSDNEKLIGRPQNFKITIREFEVASGAGFIVPILGSMMRMPGLPNSPASEHMQIDENGVISGLS